MRFPLVIRRIPGPSNQQGRYLCPPKQGDSHRQGTSTHQCTGAAFLFGIAQLLREIPAQPSPLSYNPLNALLQADRKWIWSKECEKAFQIAKEQLTSGQVLTHYDPILLITLATDASAYGVGAVISHVLPDGSE